jgi:hypothetical protein
MHRPLHVIYVANRNGEVVEARRHNDHLFAHEGGRGPHKIKISPYDKAKHVWVVDDNLHAIYKFTYDGKLVMTLGEVGVPGRGPNNFSRPTDIAWLPDGTFFISDGYVGTRVANFDPNGFHRDPPSILRPAVSAQRFEVPEPGIHEARPIAAVPLVGGGPLPGACAVGLQSLGGGGAQVLGVDAVERGQQHRSIGRVRLEAPIEHGQAFVDLPAHHERHPQRPRGRPQFVAFAGLAEQGDRLRRLPRCHIG